MKHGRPPRRPNRRREQKAWRRDHRLDLSELEYLFGLRRGRLQPRRIEHWREGRDYVTLLVAAPPTIHDTVLDVLATPPPDTPMILLPPDAITFEESWRRRYDREQPLLIVSTPIERSHETAAPRSTVDQKATPATDGTH